MSLDDSNIEKSLYPSTLFHFTSNYSVLRNILKDKHFKVSYANEKIIGLNAERNFGIPMVSFCDIRLSQLNEHTKKYGHYGLGMSKQWAIDNGLNPVNYLNHNCSVFSYFNGRCQQMNRSLRRISMKEGKDSDTYQIEQKKYRDVINVMRYMKNYEAPLIRKGVVVNKNYRFANESEWRYIPDIRTDIVPIRIVLDDLNPDWKVEANAKLGNHEEAFLKFDYGDIKYIFVKNERMAKAMIKFIMSSFDDDVYPQLISKIFISSQVFDDL
ncbi:MULTISPECIES: abortive infection system antitoxin AbiGi family protein [Pantoea]|uniref:abortive infection system antitoxin AbiGi family protein n=1 Tax=Pantoea TaxID=53335 RepID=UPI001B31846A|nr:MULTISPECIES: abortive infection system antitoxin AbiGi family protein [Pantoea]MDI3365976.1 abortive infection system antitoxin AbiGi family protein [Pantoea sp. V108_6]